jgi:hypothetical protein
MTEKVLDIVAWLLAVWYLNTPVCWLYYWMRRRMILEQWNLDRTASEIRLERFRRKP